MNLDELLRYVQRTNPDMTKEKLIKELNKSGYSCIALTMAFQNFKNKNFE